MGVLSENAIIGASAAGGYDIDYSCRWNSGSNGGYYPEPKLPQQEIKLLLIHFGGKAKQI